MILTKGKKNSIICSDHPKNTPYSWKFDFFLLESTLGRPN